MTPAPRPGPHLARRRAAALAGAVLALTAGALVVRTLDGSGSTAPVAGPVASTGAAAGTGTAGVRSSTTGANTPVPPAASTPPRPAAPTASAAPSGPATPAASAPRTGRTAAAPLPPPQAAGDLRLPVRAAFYYPWFPGAWTQQGRFPFTNYHPSAGYYDGAAAAVIDRQIADLRYAGVQAGIASWWGIGSREDQRLPLLLRRAHGTGFRWTIYYEPEGQGDPTPARISADLAHLRTDAADPAFLHVAGKAVVFVYGNGADSCATADRWAAADTRGFLVVLKVVPGYRGCAHQPGGWHQYNPASAGDLQRGYSASVSPGFWLSGQAPRLARDLARFRAGVTAVATSGAPWQLVTTYNEWGEGTAVESAQQWASPSGHGQYVDVLHQVFGAHPSTGAPG